MISFDEGDATTVLNGDDVGKGARLLKDLAAMLAVAAELAPVSWAAGPQPARQAKIAACTERRENALYPRADW